MDYGASLPMPARWYLPIFWHDPVETKFEEAVKVAEKDLRAEEQSARGERI